MHIVGFLRERLRMFIALSMMLLLVVGTVSAVVSSSSAAAETTDPAAPALKLAVAPKTALIAPDAESAEFTLEVTNSGAAKVSPRSIALFVSPTRMTSSEQLNSSLATPALPDDVGVPITTLEARTIDSDAKQSFVASIDTADLQVPTSAGPGVYLLFARIVEKGGATHIAVTPFVWHGTGTTTTTPVHSIMPLVMPNDIDGMPTANQLNELTSNGGLLRRNFEAALQRGSTLAIDPRIIVATRVLGEKAPAAATEFIAALAAAPNPTFALQYADADVSAQAQLGLESPLLPKGFTYITGDLIAQDPAVFPYSLPGVAWPRQNTITSSTLEFMTAANLSTVVADSRNVQLSAGTSGSLNAQRVVSLNANLQDAAAGALTGETALDRSASTAVLVSQLALVNQSVGSSIPQNLGVDRGGVAERDAAPLLETISALPWVSPADFAAVTSQQATATIVDSPVAPERLDELKKALAAEPTIDEYGAVLTHPIYLTQLQRMRVLEFFRTSLGVTTPGYPESTDAYMTRDAQTLNGVRVSTTSTTNLVGTTTRIPVQITNDLPFASLVSAETLAANSSLLIEESLTELTPIERRSSVNITVPVQSRVSAGQSALIVTLFAKNGQRVDEAVLPVTIRSSWEAFALGILGVLVAGFFGFGIWRSLRSRRAQGFDQGSGDAEN
jgi:hypothetical protein